MSQIACKLSPEPKARLTVTSGSDLMHSLFASMTRILVPSEAENTTSGTCGPLYTYIRSTEVKLLVALAFGSAGMGWQSIHEICTVQLVLTSSYCGRPRQMLKMFDFRFTFLRRKRAIFMQMLKKK